MISHSVVPLGNDAGQVLDRRGVRDQDSRKKLLGDEQCLAAGNADDVSHGLIARHQGDFAENTSGFRGGKHCFFPCIIGHRRFGLP